MTKSYLDLLLEGVEPTLALLKTTPVQEAAAFARAATLRWVTPEIWDACEQPAAGALSFAELRDSPLTERLPWHAAGVRVRPTELDRLLPPRAQSDASPWQTLPDTSWSARLERALTGQAGSVYDRLHHWIIVAPERALELLRGEIASSLEPATLDLARAHKLLQTASSLKARWSAEFREAMLWLQRELDIRRMWSQTFYRTVRYTEREQTRELAETIRTDAERWLTRLYARGGMGKTIFVQRIIAQNIFVSRRLDQLLAERTEDGVPRGLPCAHIDFDFVDDVPVWIDQPWRVLMAATAQLQQQIPGGFLDGIVKDDKLASVTLDAELTSSPHEAWPAAESTHRPSHDDATVQAAIDELPSRLGRALAQACGSSPVIVVLDTFERVIEREGLDFLPLIHLFAEVREAWTTRLEEGHEETRSYRGAGLRLVIAGRQDPGGVDRGLDSWFQGSELLKRRLLGFRAAYADQSRAEPLRPFSEGEARDYLNDHTRVPERLREAVLHRAREPMPGRARPDEGDATHWGMLPMRLALLAELVESEPTLAPEDLENTKADLAYLVHRVLLRVEPLTRWLLRYGVVARRLSKSIMAEVVVPFIRRAVESESFELDTKLDEEVAEELRAQLFAYVGGDDELDIERLWRRIHRYATSSSWVLTHPEHPQELRILDEVRGPMLRLVARQQVLTRLHQAAAESWAQQTDEASLREEVYHRFAADRDAALAWLRRTLHDAATTPARRRALCDELLTPGLRDEIDAEARALACAALARLNCEADRVSEARDMLNRARAAYEEFGAGDDHELFLIEGQLLCKESTLSISWLQRALARAPTLATPALEVTRVELEGLIAAQLVSSWRQASDRELLAGLLTTTPERVGRVAVERALEYLRDLVGRPGADRADVETRLVSLLRQQQRYGELVARLNERHRSLPDSPTPALTRSLWDQLRAELARGSLTSARARVQDLLSRPAWRELGEQQRRWIDVADGRAAATLDDLREDGVLPSQRAGPASTGLGSHWEPEALRPIVLQSWAAEQLADERALPRATDPFFANIDVRLGEQGLGLALARPPLELFRAPRDVSGLGVPLGGLASERIARRILEVRALYLGGSSAQRCLEHLSLESIEITYNITLCPADRVRLAVAALAYYDNNHADALSQLTRALAEYDDPEHALALLDGLRYASTGRGPTTPAVKRVHRRVRKQLSRWREQSASDRSLEVPRFCVRAADLLRVHGDAALARELLWPLLGAVPLFLERELRLALDRAGWDGQLSRYPLAHERAEADSLRALACIEEAERLLERDGDTETARPLLLAAERVARDGARPLLRQLLLDAWSRAHARAGQLDAALRDAREAHVQWGALGNLRAQASVLERVRSWDSAVAAAPRVDDAQLERWRQLLEDHSWGAPTEAAPLSFTADHDTGALVIQLRRAPNDELDLVATRGSSVSGSASLSPLPTRGSVSWFSPGALERFCEFADKDLEGASWLLSHSLHRVGVADATRVVLELEKGDADATSWLPWELASPPRSAQRMHRELRGFAAPSMEHVRGTSFVLEHERDESAPTSFSTEDEYGVAAGALWDESGLVHHHQFFNSGFDIVRTLVLQHVARSGHRIVHLIGTFAGDRGGAVEMCFGSDPKSRRARLSERTMASLSEETSPTLFVVEALASGNTEERVRQLCLRNAFASRLLLHGRGRFSVLATGLSDFRTIEADRAALLEQLARGLPLWRLALELRRALERIHERLERSAPMLALPARTLALFTQNPDLIFETFKA